MPRAHQQQHRDHISHLVPQEGEPRHRELADAPGLLPHTHRKHLPPVVRDSLDVHLAEVPEVMCADEGLSGLPHAIQVLAAEGEVVLVRAVLAAEASVKAGRRSAARQHPYVRGQHAIQHSGVVVVVVARSPFLPGLFPQLQRYVVPGCMDALVRSATAGVAAARAVADQAGLDQGLKQLRLHCGAIRARGRVLPGQAEVLRAHVCDFDHEVAERGLAPIELSSCPFLSLLRVLPFASISS
mmetsp:Transcript_92224/g.264323  ORF Transcript_92224/g.264323 Transcript_92224/m.264323 type:complete len:241 (+) Transcript_92224:505-1227(+)